MAAAEVLDAENPMDAAFVAAVTEDRRLRVQSLGCGGAARGPLDRERRRATAARRPGRQGRSRDRGPVRGARREPPDRSRLGSARDSSDRLADAAGRLDSLQQAAAFCETVVRPA